MRRFCLLYCRAPPLIDKPRASTLKGWRSQVSSTKKDSERISPTRSVKQAIEEAPELKRWKSTLEKLDQESLTKQNVGRYRTIFSFADSYGKDFVAAYLIVYIGGLAVILYLFVYEYIDALRFQMWVAKGIVSVTNYDNMNEAEVETWVRKYTHLFNIVLAFTANEVLEMIRFPMLLTAHRLFRRGTLA